ncbi:PREDICTED: uncharacterized protein LOC108549329 [Eufriesea mexicana]|uniref:uncharacterized protein LOC108549329 n=1 Tax=Eufriesea mexicana TaxID=516756 RepID=UPI00083BC7E1|nr:PREDICTED: uncharacterized protein LOC108549329 [Eufriesea mexicana]
MEYDSASNCEGRLRDFEASEDLPRLREIQKLERATCTTNSTPWQSLQVVAPQPKLKPGTTNKSLSSQVMEYYHKYSQNTNLDQYFSLPTSSTSPEAIKCYYSIYEVNPKVEANRQDCIGEEYNLRSYVPRERRRWVRPPLIGQSSNTDSSSSRYVQPLSNPESPSPDLKHVTPETILEEKNESQEILTESVERKISSPTSSIASHKPLEWDSGADVGYFNTTPNSKQNDKKLSTIERMALARGCSVALRLDPEGTTESGISGKLVGVQKNAATSITPDANSTALLGNASGSESEIEITPIVKNHLPGIIAGSGIKSAERSLPRDFKQQDTFMQYSKKEYNNDTPKSTFTTKVPFAKPSTEIKKVSSKQNTNKENICPPTSPLKKSTSMNTLFIPHSKLTLKRSQSELNLYTRDKSRAALPLIFNSSSSIATIVNKPSTCDKVIQTSLYAYTQESVGVQVSVLEEEKPPLPKRGTSLQRGSTLTLKNPKGTYKVQNSRKQETNDTRDVGACECRKETKPRHNYSQLSQNGSVRQTSQPDDTENITGRANSFEYFPGHVYENVPCGSGSHISSSETARSHSTLPNTSSSINEKLWGDSDSLVRDLERSVNILKSLVDANKCDKEVKKRLIHHVVKRLITAKYTDDKIEHNLEDNVPWNPDDARSNVYGREILQALSKQRNTSDSSREWNSQKEIQGKCVRNGRDIMKDIALESSSDKIDKNTDRTETDGRKARLGLRSDDCHRSSNTITDPDKSGSSECFFPQRNRKGNKVQDIFCVKERCKISQRDSTMTTTTTTTTMTTTTNSTPPDHNRMLLDAVVNNRRGVIRSSNTEEHDDWRMLTTFSERQFELKKNGSSVSADSKLVSYAEMEKRNQLIWITNEISHLRNLKKLLEEPRRPERPRTSPKKSRPGNFKRKPMGPLSRVHELCNNDYLQRNESEAQMNSIEEPWSSHCNLATCQVSSRSNSIVQRIKKRNSCAQTATNITGALSKTGGEIVSASNLRNSSSKLVSTGVQTIPQETYTIPALIQSEIVHYVKCPTHNAMQVQNGYKCNEQASQCLKYHAIQNLVTTCMQCAQEQKDQSNNVQKVHTNIENFREESSVDSRSPSDQMNSIISSEVIHHCANKEVQTSSLKQKEAKNQINASKSKFCDCKGSYVCRCTNDCKCENKKTSVKGCQSCTSSVTAVESNSVSKCEECQKTFQTRDRGEEKLKECNCTTVCECDNDQSKKGRAPMKYSSKYYQNSNGYVSSLNQNGCTKLCGCPNDCFCENSREPEVQNAKGFCSCHANGKTQYNEARYTRTEAEDRSTQPRPYCVTNGQANETAQYKVQNANLKCDCEKDSYCNSRGKNEEEVLHGRACNSGKPNYVDEANQTSDSDRNCKYCRHCGIPYQSVKKCSCYQTYPKAIAYELSFAKEDAQRNDNLGAFLKVPLSNRTINEGKTNGCVCNMIKKVSLKKNSIQKSTLQDYLSKNKADFVSNAETRRQYMSEISHLRQLRKEKRIQLLAMASTSNVIKSPKASSKPTVYTQRKVSDEEMRERLRKRYLRLNEMRQKRRQQEKQEESRRNKLMAKIFCKKLQQKVLRGQVNLSQSVSVISNM